VKDADFRMTSGAGAKTTSARLSAVLNASTGSLPLALYSALKMKSLLPRCIPAARQLSRPTPPLFLDFLAPSISQLGSQRRPSSTSSQQQDASKQSQSFHSPTKYRLNRSQREFLDSALRVNQAGELAATRIYTAQTSPVVRSHPHLRPLMKHMYDQEAGHFSTFNNLIAKHRVRPTAMYPVWQAASSFLGWSTGVMGREAAMACTEAVETEIGSHYNEQVREILSWAAEAERRGEELDDELKEMLEMLRRTRDEELEHLDHAVENDAKEARPYDPLVNAIRLGCRAAIKISERV
jgi:ubiquinone biosynthesis monooxygenase Coq7